VLIVVIDQFRPDYVERFDMRNVRAIMRRGVNFDRALLGAQGYPKLNDQLGAKFVSVGQ